MTDPAAAVAAAMDRMEGTVIYDAHNRHGGYQYASVDAVYAHVRPHLVERGLTVWQNEVEWDS